MADKFEIALEKAKVKAERLIGIPSPQEYAKNLREEEEIFKRIESEKSFLSLSYLFN